MPLVASIGIGAIAYNMIKPDNRVNHMIKHRMERMRQEKEVFPNS